MDTRRFDALGKVVIGRFTRRIALGRLVGGGIAATTLAVAGTEQRALAQDATPMAAPAGWRTEHLEFEQTPVDPISIVRAGSGPPQRGDHFYVDAPIYAVGDVGGTQIGTYQCFGAWTHASDDTSAPDQRLTTVRYSFDDGTIMGLINELGADPSSTFGAVQGGTGAYTGALGSFQQLPGEPPATPGAGTPPAVVPNVVRSTFDLLLPGER
jgi:hypothetical protein